MTFWNSPGVSEKLPFRCAGPKSHVFVFFFSFGKLRMSNWNVTKHRACQSKQVWDTEHRMCFRAQLAHSWFSKNNLATIAKVPVIPSLAPKCCFLWKVVQNPSNMIFLNIFYPFFFHLLFISTHFPAVFHPSFIHSALISGHIHPLSFVLHPCFIQNLYPLPIHYSLFSPIKFNSV